jgi:predicted nucleic acid-binding protein
MTEFKFIDSSIWIEYFFNNNYNEIIEVDALMTSVLSLFEVKRKLIKEKANSLEISKSIEFIKKRSIIIPVNLEIAEMSASLSEEKNIPAMDSLIYSSALAKNAILITQDNDFRGLKNVRVL